MTTRARLATAAFAALAALAFGGRPTAAAAATPAVSEPGYLRYMPTPLQVLEKTKAPDPYEQAARRYATFESLIRILGTMQGPRQFDGRATPGELRLRQEYGVVASRVAEQYIASLPPADRAGPKSKRAKWYDHAWRYEYDEGFQRRLMDTFFPPVFQQAHARAAALAAGDAARGRARMAGGSTAGAGAAGAWAELEAMIPPPLRGLANRSLWTATFAVLFALALVRTLATFRLDDGDPMRLRVGGRRWRVHRAAGTVTDIQCWHDTSVHRSPETVTASDGTSATIERQHLVVTKRLQVMLSTGPGRAHDVQLTNLEFPVAVGQRMAAAWAIRERRDNGPYVLLHNFELGRTHFLPALGEVVRPSRKPALLLLAWLLLLGASWPWVLAALVAHDGCVAIARLVRVSRFRSAFAPRLLEGLTPAAGGVTGPGGAAITPA